MSVTGARITRFAVAPVLLLAVLTAWYGPFELERTLRVEGKLFAASEWTVERSGQGTVTAILRDRRTGVTRNYVVQSVDRGDVAVLQLETRIVVGTLVESGDTVATMRSAESDARLTELTGLASIAEREAAAVSAGEKETLVEQTRARLARVREQIALQERIVERVRTLAERSLSSGEELDRARSELVALLGEADVLEAGVAVLESGGRPEDRRVATARLEAARRTLEAHLRQRSLLVLRSPIRGVVTRAASDSVLVAVMDTSAWIVAVPIPEKDRPGVLAGQGADVTVGTARVAASVIDVQPAVELMAGRPVALATLAVEGTPQGAAHGQRVQVRIRRPRTSVRAWIEETARVLLRWDTWFSNRARG